MHPSQAVINLSNLKYNFLNIRKKIKNVKIMAVIKADAYGHGVVEVVKCLNSLGPLKPEYYAVAFAEEAIELRKNGIRDPILVCEPFSKAEAEKLFKYNLIATVFSEAHLKNLLKNKPGRRGSKRKDNNPIKVHVKVDTGMNRLGISYNEAFEFIKRLSNEKNFIIDGIYTHFASADEKDKSFTLKQLRLFKKLLEELRKNKIKYGLVHSSNSAAILDLPETYFDMVRPGISLYGYYPSLETSESIPLKPVMSIISYVTSVKEIQPGETVSYGRRFKTNRRTKIVSVPIGYADGFRRNLADKSMAIIKGKYYQQVGTVTMDRIMFDVNEDNIRPGDKAILLGSYKNLKINAWDWAKVLNTIPYEVTCGITKRLPRIYIY